VDCPPFTRTGYSLMNLSLWRKQSEKPSICMNKVKGRRNSVDLAKTRSRTIRIRERRGLTHLLFGEVHCSKDRESPVSIRFLNQMGKGKDSLLNVGDVEEITSKGFALSKVKAQWLHITFKRRIQ